MNHKPIFLLSTYRTVALAAAVFATTPHLVWAQNAPLAAPVGRTIVPAQTQKLLNAMRKGDREAARAAIMAGADTNVTGTDGMTPLMRAAQLRQADTVQLLLANGASAKVQDKAGRTALHYVVPEGTPEQPKPKKKNKWGNVLGGLSSVASGGLMGGMRGGLGNMLGVLGSSALGGLLSGSPLGGSSQGGITVGAANGQPQMLDSLTPQELATFQKIKATVATRDEAALEALMQTPEVSALIQKLDSIRATQVDEDSRSIIAALLRGGASPLVADLQGKTPATLAQERGLLALADLLTFKPAAPTKQEEAEKAEQFQALTHWKVRLDKVQVARKQLEVFITARNTTGAKMGLAAGQMRWKVTDADGITFSDTGDIFRASGAPNAEPRPLTETLWLEPGEEAKARYVFAIPADTNALSKLTVTDAGYGSITYDVSNISLR